MTAAESAELLSRADRSLDDGLALKRWWDERERRRDYPDRFDLRRSFNPSGDSYGFFDVAPVRGAGIPVLGMVQEMLFDKPKQCSPEQTRQHLREFVLRYLMRVSSFRRPDAYATARSCIPFGAEEMGFGYTQHYLKTRGGHPTAIPVDSQKRIFDLRDIAEHFDWVVMKVNIYSFNLRFSPLGTDVPNIVIPLSESTYLAVTRDFIIDETIPREGSIGRYGFGYATVKNPGSSTLAYGPGQFDLGFQNFEFTVLPDGSSSVRMAFVVNRPYRIFNLPLDPVYTFIDAANFLSGGLAARYYCISRRELETVFLVQHYMQHYDMIVGALSTWCQVADWLHEDTLPRWVVEGRTQ